MSRRTTATCYCGAVQLEIASRRTIISLHSKTKIYSSQSKVTASSTLTQGLSPRDWHNVRLERKSPIERYRSPWLTPANVHQITVETPHLRHIRGEDNLSAYATAKTINTGNTMTSSFCKTCGALMYRRSSGFPGLSFCRIGTVDEIELHDEVLKPMAEQFTVSRAKWLEPVEGVRQTEGMSTE
ncbi:hypothetical protein LTR95_000466 [Oleoguttula sp. CCFEE 5521]